VLKETGLRPERLGIEITETLAMQDTELTSRNLKIERHGSQTLSMTSAPATLH
jgi:EAL domain-containing protein (putative c-di-GMP-specific phosphodiesterase class I)